MSGDIRSRAKALFLEALERPATEREGFVEDRGRGDDALVREVLSLLAYHEPGDLADREALAPGSLFADRYRILRPIGRGGIGWVYEARDETLGISVALKYLTRLNEAGAASLINEVRLGRSVTHPAVCRIFDVGVSDGSPFLTMEMVQGEDLASLLKRAGRLPPARVQEIGQTLSLALAAAHAKKVLHRDLKPANVLVDREGAVKITDFGVATVLDGGPTSAAGTPAYMAPERFVLGAPGSERTDIFSLGALLYELLTGRPAFPALTLDDAKSVHAQGPPPAPSTLSPAIPQELESVVMSALSFDPDGRPHSAIDFAQRLGAGSALAIAVSVGVTPSPSVVARASDSMPAMRRAVAASWLGLASLGLVVATIASAASSPLSMVAGVAPSTRAMRASEVLTSLGHEASSAETAQGFIAPAIGAAWTEPLFWYRTTLPADRDAFARMLLDPSRNALAYVSGPSPPMRSVLAMFDTQDRLVYLNADSAAPATPGVADTAAILRAAGLTAVERTPLLALDETPEAAVAWRATPDGERAATITASWDDGTPSHFSVIPDPSEEQVQTAGGIQLLNLISLPIVLAIFMIAVWTALRNARTDRIDTSGAMRIVTFVSVMMALRWILLWGVPTHPEATGVDLAWGRFQVAWVSVLLPAVFYVAFEPEVRRRRPETLVAWSALVLGEFGNRAVGRALLIGAAAGVVVGVIRVLAPLAFPDPLSLSMNSLDEPPRFLAAAGPLPAVALLLREAADAVGRGGLALFVFVWLLVKLRDKRLALGLFVLILGTLEALTAGGTLAAWLAIGIPHAAIFGALILKSDLLALVTAMAVGYVVRFAPLTVDPRSWYVVSSLVATVAILGIALVGARLATRTRRGFEAPA